MTNESKKQGEKRMGRPPEPVPKDKADAIIAWLSAGQTLREWCRENDVHYSTVYLWCDKDEDFAQRFARAREIGQDLIAEECLEIIDQEPSLNVTQFGSSYDGASVSWAKNRAEMRLKLLAKWNPKRWGDKVDLTSDGKAVGLAINIDLKPEAA